MKWLLIIFSALIAAEAFTGQSSPSQFNQIAEGKFFFFLHKLFFNPSRDIQFQLFTRRNPLVGQRILLWDSASLFESNFNISSPTRFLIHGWGGDSESFFNEDATEAYLTHSDFNVIRVDWARGAQTINYITARNRVDPTGRVLAEFIDFLHESGVLRFEELTVAGFSLGAHIAGIAGKAVRYGRINTIIGLDPAGPLFSLRNVDARLDRRDADYVEVIHTNSRVSGIGFPIGHADFFPNGGNMQPGCLRNFCSHDRAPKFFTESINNNNFQARRCESIADVVEGGCSGTPLVTMGGEPSNARNNVRGIFHLTTNRSSPFAQGCSSSLCYHPKRELLAKVKHVKHPLESSTPSSGFCRQKKIPLPRIIEKGWFYHIIKGKGRSEELEVVLDEETPQHNFCLTSEAS